MTLKKQLIGWKEWCALPDLDIPAIKAKVDTGAKTSSLHAYDINTFKHAGELWVEFKLHPLQRNHQLSIIRKAKVIDQRHVTSSSGHKELRYVIKTRLVLADIEIVIELTLANRENMVFKMLLGRDALKGHATIDPSLSQVSRRLSTKQAKKFYKKDTTHAHSHSSQKP